MDRVNERVCYTKDSVKITLFLTDKEHPDCKGGLLLNTRSWFKYNNTWFLVDAVSLENRKKNIESKMYEEFLNEILDEGTM